MSEKGILFDIQRFSLNDGPGIRTTLFFKGCFLKCVWCHNPESISPRVQINHNAKKCKLCGKCVEFVNGDGIEIIDNELIIDFDKHGYNFDLIDVCPNNAYGQFGQEYSVDELVEIILKDKDYYVTSNGGVTFSGGEAINQIDFLNKLGLRLKELNINMCLDMSGYDPLFKVQETVDYIDEYLLDYKLTAENKYERYVGPHPHFEQSIDFLAKHNKKVTLRCPIIPSVNDNDDHFKAISEISRKYKNIEKVDILPYHNMVKNFKFKYANKPEFFEMPTEKTKAEWRLKLESFGLINGWLDNQKI